MQSVSKGTGLQRRRKRTLEKRNLLILLLLTYLIASTPNNLLFIRARLAKKTKTIKEVFDVVGGKNKVVAITSLQ